MKSNAEITLWLRKWRAGDESAQNKLLEAIYPTLVHIASTQLARQRGVDTLCTRDLAHEAFLKMSCLIGIEWSDRAHLFSVLAKVMRRYVVDYVRAKSATKRSGVLPLVSVAEPEDERANRIDDWLGLDQALAELEEVDQESADIVEMKFFSGLTTDEIAEAACISRATVVRRWRFARSWLAERMEGFDE